jgi:ribosomal 50S subunit-recycling heat shock protein
MRLDKYLKVSRIIKRRTIAKECVDRGLVTINSKTAKASSEVKVGDMLEVKIKNKILTYRIEIILEYATEEKAATMYALLEEKNQ